MPAVWTRTRSGRRKRMYDPPRPGTPEHAAEQAIIDQAIAEGAQALGHQVQLPTVATGRRNPHPGRQTAAVLEFAANNAGRDFVVGDVHGCFRTLERALTAVGFDGKHDRLFGVGDLIARGPDSAEALSWLETRFAGVTRGNREDAAMTWLADRLDDSTEPPYGWLTSIAPDQYRRWHDALARLPLAITIETASGRVGIVHAESPHHSWRRATELLDAGRELDVALLGWPGTPETVRRYRSRPVEGLRALVHGHEPVAAVEQTANRWNIDTGAGFANGQLTLARIDSDPITIVTVPCG